jgi:4-hydroxybenzoate polyprenyltransferase
MAAISDFIKLIRPKQWYKNFLVFLPIIFVGKVFDLNLLLLTIIGFASLCAISSANYILNDIFDIKNDRLHPEKKTRPLAAGRISIWVAILFMLVLVAVSGYLAFNLAPMFRYSIIALFVLTQLYSLWFKKEMFADIVIIGVNFVIRAISGAFIINVTVSSWLIVGVFFFAMFLAAGKRHAELLFLGEKATAHRATLKQYTKELTSALMVLTTALLIIAYSLYSFFSEHKNLFITLPFAIYAIFRYFNLVYSGSPIARHPEKVFGDVRMIVAMLLWGLLTLYLMYFA